LYFASPVAGLVFLFSFRPDHGASIVRRLDLLAFFCGRPVFIFRLGLRPTLPPRPTAPSPLLETHFLPFLFSTINYRTNPSSTVRRTPTQLFSTGPRVCARATHHFFTTSTQITTHARFSYTETLDSTPPPSQPSPPPAHPTTMHPRALHSTFCSYEFFRPGHPYLPLSWRWW